MDTPAKKPKKVRNNAGPMSKKARHTFKVIATKRNMFLVDYFEELAKEMEIRERLKDMTPDEDAPDFDDPKLFPQE